MAGNDDDLIRKELTTVFADIDGRPEPDWHALSRRLNNRPRTVRAGSVRVAVAAAVLLLLGGAMATVPILRRRSVILEENRIFLEAVLADGLFESSRTSSLWEPELPGLFDEDS